MMGVGVCCRKDNIKVNLTKCIVRMGVGSNWLKIILNNQPNNL